MLRQTPEISKAINPGTVGIAPSGLQCITAHQIESDKLKALPGIADMRTHNETEHIRLAAAGRAGTRAPQQFEFQKRLGAIVPGNGEFVSDLLDVVWFKSHLKSESLFGHGLGLLLLRTLTKDRRADAHQCRALFNSN